MSLRRKLLFVIPLAIALAIAGCKINTINYFPPHQAQVRVLNLMTDAPAIDVQIAGATAFTNVAFEAATGYQDYDNTTTTFAVTLSGSTQTLASFTYPLAGEQPYTLLLYGTTLSPQITMVAEIANAPTNGNIQLSVFNAAQNQAAVDIYVTAPGADIAVLNPNFSTVSFGGTTFNLAFPPGTYQIQVTVQGTKQLIFDSGGTVLTPNIALSFITYTRGSGTLVNASVLQSRGPIGLLNSIFARIKAVNAASGIGPVNQLIATLPVNLNVPYTAGSPYSLIPQGSTTVNFEASATPGATIASTPAAIGPSTDVSAIITGLPGSQQAFVLNDQNLPLSNGGDRLRFVNASPGSNPVNAQVNGTQFASNVVFASASPYALMGPNTVTITFADAATGALVATLENVVLIANQTSSVYLVGPVGAQAIIITQDN